MQLQSSVPGVQLLDAPVSGCPQEAMASPATTATHNNKFRHEVEEIVMVGARSLSKTRGRRNLAVFAFQVVAGAGAFVVSVRRSYFLDFQMMPSR